MLDRELAKQYFEQLNVHLLDDDRVVDGQGNHLADFLGGKWEGDKYTYTISLRYLGTLRFLNLEMTVDSK